MSTHSHTTYPRRYLETTDARNGGNYRRHDPVSSSPVCVIHKRLWNRSNGGQHKQKLPLWYKPYKLYAAGGGVKQATNKWPYSIERGTKLAHFKPLTIKADELLHNGWICSLMGERLNWCPLKRTKCHRASESPYKPHSCCSFSLTQPLCWAFESETCQIRVKIIQPANANTSNLQNCFFLYIWLQQNVGD